MEALSDSELRHRVAELCLIGYQGAGDPIFPQWNHWGLYLDRVVTLEVVARLATILRKHRSQYDILCPVPTSGFPLGAMLYQNVDVPVLASFHWRDAEFHAESSLRRFIETLGHPPRVCAIDSSISTGSSLYLSQQMIKERLGGTVDLVVTVVDNDVVLQEFVDPIKAEFISSRKLFTLFKVSDLESLWSGRREHAVRRRAAVLATL